VSWFKRHLNWSLFFAIILIPFVVSSVLGIFIFGGMITASISSGGLGTEPSPEFFSSLLTTMLPFVLVSLMVSLGLFIWDIVAVIWYLGQKARSKGFVVFIIAPSVFAIVIRFLGIGIIGDFLGALTAIACVVALFLLQNHSLGNGDESGYELASDRWPDTNLPGGYDDRQTTGIDYTKELDYTPSQNVMDIALSQPTKDIKYTSDVPLSGSQDMQQVASEVPPPEKAPEKAVGRERPQMPILLDDSGAVISCSYHPGADAVSLCSRCKKYICIDCNYITGTNPVCRNCWERRAEFPIAPPQKAGQGPRKPEKKKVVEPPPPKPEQKLPAEPEALKITEVSQPAAAEPTLIESVKPVEQVVQQPVEPEPQPVAQTTIPTQPEFIEPIPSEKQKAVKPEKSAKEEAEKREWQSEFMGLYQQAAPIIHVVVSKSADGMPASPLDLMEGLKLRPMLERVKKLSKPKDKELREAKSQLEHLLSSCIKIADAAANFISGGGQALLGGPDFKRIVEGIETANGLMEKLSQNMATFSLPQE
jgi:hypothetical protein